MRIIILTLVCSLIGFLFYYYLSKISKVETFQEELSINQEPEQLYELNTDKIKYKLYDYQALTDSGMQYLYHLFVIKIHWINEKYHSAFFKILLTLDENELMIINSNSKVLTLNIRDNNNKMTQSTSYEVFSTKEILESVLRQIHDKILNFNKSDAQNITLAICIIAIQKSMHYMLLEKPLDLIENILGNYNNTQNVEYILSLIDEQNEQLLFVEEAFEYSLIHSQTYPYNDYGVEPANLRIALSLPQKTLK